MTRPQKRMTPLQKRFSLSRIGKRWRYNFRNPWNRCLMKTTRIGVNGIIIAQSGSDYIFKAESTFKKHNCMWTPQKQWIGGNIRKRWDKLTNKRPVKNALLPPGFDDDLSKMFSRVKPAVISFQNIIIGKPLLRLLSSILANYDPHTLIVFAEFKGVSQISGVMFSLWKVTFDDDVTSTDISAMFRHFLYHYGIPPKYWDPEAFYSIISNVNRDNYAFAEDYDEDVGFNIRNKGVEYHPISLTNFSRVYEFVGCYAVASIKEIIEAAKARMVHEKEKNFKWIMAAAKFNTKDVEELVDEVAKGHSIEVKDKTTVIQAKQFYAKLTINSRDAFFIYGGNGDHGFVKISCGKWETPWRR